MEAGTGEHPSGSESQVRDDGHFEWSGLGCSMLLIVLIPVDDTARLARRAPMPVTGWIEGAGDREAHMLDRDVPGTPFHEIRDYCGDLSVRQGSGRRMANHDTWRAETNRRRGRLFSNTVQPGLNANSRVVIRHF